MKIIVKLCDEFARNVNFAGTSRDNNESMTNQKLKKSFHIINKLRQVFEYMRRCIFVFLKV